MIEFSAKAKQLLALKLATWHAVRGPLWVKNGLSVERSYVSFRQLRTCWGIGGGQNWRKGWLRMSVHRPAVLARHSARRADCITETCPRGLVSVMVEASWNGHCRSYGSAQMPVFASSAHSFARISRVLLPAGAIFTSMPMSKLSFLIWFMRHFASRVPSLLIDDTATSAT